MISHSNFILVAGVSLCIACSPAAGQKHTSNPSVGVLTIDPTHFQECRVTKKQLAGRMKIVLSASSMTYVFGAVAPRSAWAFNQAEQDGNDDDDDDVDVNNPNKPTGTGNIKRTDPFHLYVRATDFPAYDSSHPYLLVRVVIPAGGAFTFYHIESIDNFIQGVAASKSQPSDAVCAPGPIGVPPISSIVNKPRGRQVARFYVDLSKLKTVPIPFSILLTPNTAPETTIIIDPKVYNDG